MSSSNQSEPEADINMRICSPDSKIKNEESDNIKNDNIFNTVNPSINRNPFASEQNKISKNILRPAQLSFSNASSNKSFVLKPSTLSVTVSKICEENQKDKNNEFRENDKQASDDAPKFVPLVKQTENSNSQNSSLPNSVLKTAQESNFVFGQNIEERVVGDQGKQADSRPSTSLSSNGSNDMLFTAAAKQEGKNEGRSIERETKSLTESAKEYEESRNCKRKYEEVDIKTGEEEETNILSISCKLFSFDKNSGSWQERGRGTLRLNDFENDGRQASRLVFRTAGSLRLVLNTKIWADMMVDKASDKSIRFTALDASGEIKVFLVMTNIESTKQLYSHLQCRLDNEISFQKKKKSESEEK